MDKNLVNKKIEFYKRKREEMILNNSKIPNVNIRKKIHPLLCNILKIKRTLIGQNITVINNNAVIPSNRAVIYAVTHIGRYDFEMVTEILKSFAYALSGDWDLMYGTIDDYFFRIHGVIYVDTEDKKDRKLSYDMAVKALKQGIPLIWFPEGIWNLSDHLPMLGLYRGVVNAARETGAEIIPIAVDQKDKEFYINIGKNINANDLSDDGRQELRDIMATLKWEIWEKFPVENRKNIPSDYYEKFLEERIREWPAFDLSTIKHREFREKNQPTKEEVFDFLYKMNITDNNKFLFMPQVEYVKTLRKCNNEKIK